MSLCQLRANGEYTYLWSAEDSRRSGISCLKAYDITKDGFNEVGTQCRVVLELDCWHMHLINPRLNNSIVVDGVDHSMQG